MTTERTINMPAVFAGTEAERARNRLTHHFDREDRCQDCDCRPWGRVAEWPCGTEPPRVEVEHDAGVEEMHRRLVNAAALEALFGVMTNASSRGVRNADAIRPCPECP